MGSAAALLSLLASADGTSSLHDFRVVFVVEAAITLCALMAYRGLAADAGASISGYRSDLAID
jgi:hypothetical protein